MSNPAIHHTAFTFTYKTVAGVRCQADLTLPEDITPGKPLPLLVFFHGGGLFSGSRAQNAWFPAWLADAALDAGFGMLAADYTLLSPATGHAVIDDVKDLFKWIATHLNHKISSVGSSQIIDTKRIAVAGVSAGGYLSYLSALYAIPRPKAVLSLYGMGGDYLLDHWVTPHTEPFYRSNGALRPLIPSITPFLPITNAAPSSPLVVETSSDREKEPRMGYLLWLLQTGTFVDVLTGHKGMGKMLGKLEKKERAAAIPEDAKGLFPDLVADVNFPPTCLIHGQEDSLVPVAESRNMASALERLGVEVELIEVPRGDHGFDLGLGNASEVISRAIPFLLEHLAV